MSYFPVFQRINGLQEDLSLLSLNFSVFLFFLMLPHCISLYLKDRSRKADSILEKKIAPLGQRSKIFDRSIQTLNDMSRPYKCVSIYKSPSQQVILECRIEIWRIWILEWFLFIKVLFIWRLNSIGFIYYISLGLVFVFFEFELRYYTPIIECNPTALSIYMHVNIADSDMTI